MEFIPMSLLSIFGLGQPYPQPDQRLQNTPPNLPQWGAGQISNPGMNIVQQELNSASIMLGAQLQNAVYNAPPLETFVENVPDDEATVPVNLKQLYSERHVEIIHMQRCLHV
jgi:hypothetical protein